MSPPVRPLGFMVWSPEGRMPTVVHHTLEKAIAEASRLRAMHPSERFVVMAPLVGPLAGKAASAWEAGLRAGEAQAHREIMRAEGETDRLLDENASLKRQLGPARAISQMAEEHRATVADCQLWFDGFRAAHILSDVTPKTPDASKLQRLNCALGDLTSVGRFHAIDDEEIPF